jgi:type II secretion system protein I
MKRAAGFTLVEVLVAITVIVISMAALATMSLTALRSVARNGERTVAVSVAQSRLESLRSRPIESLEDGSIQEPLSGHLAGYVATTHIETGAPRLGVVRVTVTVDTPSGQTLRLATLIGS